MSDQVELHSREAGGCGASRTPWRLILALAAVAVAVFGWMRAGLLDLPPVPSGLTLAAAGLEGLDRMKRLDAALRGPPGESDVAPAAALVRQGIVLIARGSAADGLELMRRGIRQEPDNPVLANAYRMETFRLRRDFLMTAAGQSDVAPTFPPHLEKQPIAFFESLVREHPSRETRLALALAWVDLMLLYPALEIKAPASVEAVKILSGILDGDDPNYVPALFARGLNHLHRPSRLVWPESGKTPLDAAAQDIGRCVAIGRKLDTGSPRLQARLAIALGDAYVKAGRLNTARSWWQVAQNLCRDADVQEAIRRRYGWRDEEALDKLEEDLDRARGELNHPMTDLAMMWE